MFKTIKSGLAAKLFIIITFLLILIASKSAYGIEKTYGINTNNQTVQIETESISKQSILYPSDHEKEILRSAVDSYSTSLIMYDRVNQIIVDRTDIFAYPSLSMAKISKNIWVVQYLKLKYVDENNTYNYLIEKEYLWKWDDDKPTDRIKDDILKNYILDTNPLIILEK